MSVPADERLDEAGRKRLADARAIWRAGVAAVEPGKLVRTALRRMGARLELPPGGRVIVLGAGKAGAGMLAGAVDVLGDLVAGGLVAVPGPAPAAASGAVELAAAGHPEPTAGSEAAARRALEWAGRAGPDDLVLGLVSGGGSALLALPAPGLSLADKAAATRALLDSGAPIETVNAIRKHLSAVKGGLLAAACGEARVAALILSDVPGDDPSSVASGPFAPDPTTYADCLAAIERHDLAGRLPAAIREHLAAGARGQRPETPKPGDPRLARAVNAVIGGRSLAGEGAARETWERGYGISFVPEPVRGTTERLARRLAAELDYLRGQGTAPWNGRLPVLLLAGEPEVRVTGPGRGGRCTDLALRAALELAGRPGWLLLAAGTDGRDGSTDAAGAWVDGGTIAAARRAGLDPEAALAAQDSHTFFDRLGQLERTGPTGTNVGDLFVLMTD